jgi:hypothetical protein
MAASIGSKIWAIPEGYIPSKSTGPQPDMTSHETACILNAGDVDAHLELMIYYTDKEPIGPYKVIVPARRSKHVRFNNLHDPAEIPKDTEYSCVIRSDQPIVVQHTRLDSRQAENALMTTMAFPLS